MGNPALKQAFLRSEDGEWHVAIEKGLYVEHIQLDQETSEYLEEAYQGILDDLFDDLEYDYDE